MLALIFSVLVMNGPTLKAGTPVRLPSEVFIVESLAACEDGTLVVLDRKSHVIAKVDPDGTSLTAGRRGQGPGELNIPLSIACADQRVFVGDYKLINVYDADTLRFIKQIPTENNCLSLSFFEDELFLATGRFPSTGYSMQVLDQDGKVLRELYEHHADGAPEQMKIPYVDQGSDGTLYFLHHQAYRIDILDRQGHPARAFKVHPSPRYKPVTSLAALEKKYGLGLVSWHRWQSEWSVSSRIAVVDDRYLWVCFQELQEDMRTYKYFVDVYDLDADNQKIISWREMPGRLYDGGRAAYFVEAIESKNDDYQTVVVPYEVVP